MSLAATSRLSTVPTHWELAAETIAVKIRWFGLLVGYVLVNVAANTPERRAVLNAILSFGAVFTLLDTWFSLRGRIFLGHYPLFISSIEALFIALLCYFDTGLESPFRYYYLLSLICCAIRHSLARHLRHLRPALSQLRRPVPGPARRTAAVAHAGADAGRFSAG